MSLLKGLGCVGCAVRLFSSLYCNSNGKILKRIKSWQRATRSCYLLTSHAWPALAFAGPSHVPLQLMNPAENCLLQALRAAGRAAAAAPPPRQFLLSCHKIRPWSRARWQCQDISITSFTPVCVWSLLCHTDVKLGSVGTERTSAHPAAAVPRTNSSAPKCGSQRRHEVAHNAASSLM